MTDNQNEHGLITAKELAERAKVTPQRIRQVLSAGEIPGAYKLGYTWIVPRTAAENWLQRRAEP